MTDPSDDPADGDRIRVRYGASGGPATIRSQAVIRVRYTVSGEGRVIPAPPARPVG